jgi:hypothetical protein
MMTQVSLDGQPDAVKQFVLSLAVDPQGSVVALNGRTVARVMPPGDSSVATLRTKNGRRKRTPEGVR